jgi:hypothetical protein
MNSRGRPKTAKVQAVWVMVLYRGMGVKVLKEGIMIRVMSFAGPMVTSLVTTARRPCSVSWWPFCKYISPFKVYAFWDLMKTKCGRNASSLHYVRLE